MGKLLAIDGLNIVRRVYLANREADRDAEDPQARAETALRHALASFRKLLGRHQPSHVLPVFEQTGQSWRHALHPPYRQLREPLPPELRDGLPGFWESLQGIGLAPLAPPEAETADVVATAALRWLAEGRGEVVVAANDKHLHLLLAHGVQLWDHFKGEWHDAAWLRARYGVGPELLEDLLALMGDVHDGIPGVSKIGVKTGAKLLNAYGSLDAVLAGAGILPGPMGERLRRERAALDLSRRLVRLKTDVRLGVTWKMLAWDGPGLAARSAGPRFGPDSVPDSGADSALGFGSDSVPAYVQDYVPD